MLRFAAIAGSVLLAMATAAPSPVAAQNYESQFQVRFGAFLQGASVSGTAVENNNGAITTEPFRFGSAGIGAAAGIEYVRWSGMSVGLEFDLTALSGSDDPLATKFGTNYLATLRGRAGFHMRPDLFWYVTGGLGALGTSAKLPGGFTTPKVSSTRYGGVVGTGFEWGIGPTMVFAEYLYGSFGTADFDASATRTFTYDPDMHIFRIGLKFKTGYDHYHDDVAERIGRRPTK